MARLDLCEDIAKGVSNAVERPLGYQILNLGRGEMVKLADFIDNGSDAKWVLMQGTVEVNGELETRRGRQLTVGDVVTFEGRSAVVTQG